MGFRQILSDVFFPKNFKCLICGREIQSNGDYSICTHCESNFLINLYEKICKTCGSVIYSMFDYCLNCKSNASSELDIARAYLTYDENISKLVKDLKFNKKKYIAPLFSEMIFRVYEFYGISADIVTAVPIHKAVLKKRKFNQSQLIAQGFCQKAALPYDFDSFKKIKDTSMQLGLTKAQRQNNLKDAFKLFNKQQFKGKDIVLIDDVFTTGATANECAKVLKNGGAKNVIVLTVSNVKPKFV